MNLQIGKLYHFSDQIFVQEDLHSEQQWSVMDKSGKNCVDVLHPFTPFLLLDQQKNNGEFHFRLRILTLNGKDGFIHLYKNELKKFLPSKETC
jgi:hypothetical protein